MKYFKFIISTFIVIFIVLFLLSGSGFGISNNNKFFEGMVDGNDISLVSTIADGTTPENAEKSISTIQGISNLNKDPFFKTILNDPELTDYEKIIIIKTFIRKLRLDNSIKNNTTLSGISNSTYSLHKYCKI